MASNVGPTGFPDSFRYSPQPPGSDSSDPVRNPADIGSLKKKLLEGESLGIFLGKEFAMLHGDTFLEGSKFQGGDLTDSVNYWVKLLEKWKTQALIDPGLSPAEIDEALEDYRDVLKAERINNGKELLSFIQRRLSERGRCAIAFRVLRKHNDSGHTFACVFTQEKSGAPIFLHLLNKGGSAEMHPLVEETETKRKLSYKFYPIRFNDPTFFSPKNEVRVSLFNRLIKFRRFFPKADEKDYSSKEIYEFFLLFGEIDTTRSPTKADATTSQRSGICPMQCAKLLLRHQMRGPEMQRKRVFFAARFQSFVDFLLGVDGYINSSKKPRETKSSICAIARKSLLGFCTLVEKLKSSLTVEEVHLTETLIELLEEKMTSLEKSLVDASLKRELFPLKGEFETQMPCQLKPTNHSDWLRNFYQPKSPAVISFVIPPKPSDLNYFIEDCWSNELDNLTSRHKKVLFVYQALSHLPIPTLGKDDYWSRFSAAEAKKCLDVLHQFVLKGFKTIHEYVRKDMTSHYKEENYYNFCDMMIRATALAIADKLAHQIPDMKLEGWRVEFYLYNDLKKKEEFFLSHGDEAERLQKINTYFGGQTGEVLWDWNFEFGNIDLKSITKSFDEFEDFHKERREDSLNNRVHLWVDSQKGSSVDKSLVLRGFSEGKGEAKFLCFVNQFGDKARKMGLRADSSANFYAQLWIDYMPKIVPSFSRFQDFVFLSRGNIRVSESKRSPEIIRTKDNNIVIIPGYRFERVVHPEVNPSLFQLANCMMYEWKCENALSLTKGSSDRWVIDLSKKIWKNSAVAQEIAKIKLYPSNVVASLLNWMRENPVFLNNRAIQQEVMRALLQPGSLQKAFECEPQVVKQLRKFLEKTIDHALKTPSQRSSAFFWLRLRYRLETYLSEQHSTIVETSHCLNQKLDVLLSKEHLSEAHRAEALLLKIYMRRHITDFSDEELKDLYQTHVALAPLQQGDELALLQIEAALIFKKIAWDSRDRFSRDLTLVDRVLTRAAARYHLNVPK